MHFVGFVVDGRVPGAESGPFERRLDRRLLCWLKGASSDTAVARMRFGWIAEEINRGQSTIHYELYRPWRRYSAVVFVKSMNMASRGLMEKLRSAGVKVLFDANVDYFSRPEGTYYYEGMAPTAEQRRDALDAVSICDAVIADSTHIGRVVTDLGTRTETIEDNVQDSLIRCRKKADKADNTKINLWWSGQAVKLFDLLAIRDVLLACGKSVRLNLVTNSLDAVRKWYPQYRQSFEEMLDRVEHNIIAFTDIPRLMELYDQGGIFISPRFLNNSYNLGHTEWKITLPLARGCPVLCSPQLSYQQVSERANGSGIHICSSDEDWLNVLENFRTGRVDWEEEQSAASRVVREHYATSVLAAKHRTFIEELIGVNH